MRYKITKQLNNGRHRSLLHFTPVIVAYQVDQIRRNREKWKKFFDVGDKFRLQFICLEKVVLAILHEVSFSLPFFSDTECRISKTVLVQPSLSTVSSLLLFLSCHLKHTSIYCSAPYIENSLSSASYTTSRRQDIQNKIPILVLIFHTQNKAYNV
jgi:hypothetical protein